MLPTVDEQIAEYRMYRVIECLTLNHAYGLVALAAFVCMVGSCLLVLLNRRLIQTTGRRRQVQLLLTSIMGGTTIWSTHFIAMTVYDPGVGHAYEPEKTLLSLVLAVLGVLVSNLVLAQRQWHYGFAVSGAIFGVTTSAMHFVGMAAYLVPGTLTWDRQMIAISVALGVVLGVAAHRRIAHPTTGYSWLGGVIFMVLAICTMHFIGMAAFDIRLDGTVDVPPQIISDATLAKLIIAVTSVILLIGFASFTIETDVQLQAKSELEHASHHDPMTGLPNRMLLDQTLDEFQQRLSRDSLEQVAILTIDLNAFKEVNDLYGHATGDVVLKTLASRFLQLAQGNEFVARVGGTEFVALKHGFGRKADVFTFAERLLGVILQPVVTAQASIMVSATIGTALSATDGQDLRTLLQKSALAMQHAKTMPETAICPFDAGMDTQNRGRVMLAHDLRSAIANGEFELAYQFQNKISSRAVVGFEALLRWTHPTRGPVSPAEFIPIAEDTGQICEIGLWVLRTACAEAATWDTPYSIAVNVAAQQLIQTSFIENVSDILMSTRLHPSRLELEITEAGIIHDQTNTFDVMHRLQKMGIRIAMDDFGTGYSSLATLQAFPFDKIKIDKSFVQDLHKNKKRAAIVKATLLLAEAFNIPVLAEGVETEEELAFLNEIRCNTAQGFYFGKPMRLAELHAAIMADAMLPQESYAS